MPRHHKLHPSLERFFTEHRPKSEKHICDMHDQLRPITQVCRAVRQHVMELQSALHDAELEATGGGVDPKLQYMHTRLAALEARAAEFFAAARALAATLREVDAGLTQDHIDMAAFFAAQITSATPVPPPEAPDAVAG